jgi:hypothetical protein
MGWIKQAFYLFIYFSCVFCCGFEGSDLRFCSEGLMG